MFIRRPSYSGNGPTPWRRLCQIAAALMLVLLLLAQLCHTSSNAHSPPSVHFLVPIDAPSLLFCQSLFTAFLHDYKPVLINFNTTESRQANGNRVRNQELKIYGVYNYLVRNTTNDDDIVIMADGTDVWWQLPLDVLIDRYIRMDAPLIFSAEKNCFPSGDWCKDIPESTLPRDAYGNKTDKYHPRNNRPRWLNSGLIIGRAKYMREVFGFAYELKKAGVPGMDQEILLQAYKTQEYNISLDFRSEIFQNIWGSEEDIVWKDLGSGRIIDVDNDRLDTPEASESPRGIVGSLLPRFLLGARTSTLSSLSPLIDSTIPIILPFNKITSTIAACIHFNGGGQSKDHAIPFWQRTWWVRLARLGPDRKEAAVVRRKVEAGSVRVSEDARKVGWNELCGRIMPLDWLHDSEVQ